ncbi:hypothetical protein [Nocardia terpenica]|uniref:Integral membrane protein n=1 Tax=Nocardia terpenica TaxID=455432 RepID=A0A291RF17_9NOCA|nr:hypothetical protein [Nocardia terpenica]ATL66181.1 hypothetical protein CRH09_08210 [Nocardia terpenica]
MTLPTTPTADAAARWRPWYNRLRVLVLVNAVLATILLIGAIRAPHLPSQAWNRVGAAFALSLVYIALVFWLNRGVQTSPVALQRLHRSALFGPIGMLIVICVPGEYPMWMRGEQVVQLLLLLGVVYIVRRPEVDAMFPGWKQLPRRRRRRRAAR